MLITVNGTTFERPENLTHFEAMMWDTIYLDTLNIHAHQFLQKLEAHGQTITFLYAWTGLAPEKIVAANLASLVIYTYRQDGGRIRV